MPKVFVLFTGGTIASRVNPKTGKVEASVSGEDLLKLVPRASSLADLESTQFSNVSGHTMTLERIFELTQRIRQVAEREDIDGVVVTHGTAGLEEAAFMADLVVSTSKPVVFTGAMYNASFADTDGPRNLLNAIRLAVTPEAQDLGVLVCLNGQVHAARDAVKIHTTQLQSFSSFEHGLLGQVDNDRAIIYRRPTLRYNLPVDRIVSNVDLIKAAIGMDDRYIKTSISYGAKGIVIESLPGTGSVTPGMIQAIKEALSKGIVVVIASRCPTGRAIPVYGGGCGSKDVAELGCIMAGDLPSAKARILLAVALGKTDDRKELASIFEKIAP